MAGISRVTVVVISGMLMSIGYPTPSPSAEVNREPSLIERLGQSDITRAQQPAKEPTREDIKAAARTIDEYLAVYYKENKVAPNPRANDDVFLRRAYLDIAGRIPTIQEVVEFRRDTLHDRRMNVIDKLLASEAYVSNNFNFWADVLRIQSEMRGGGVQYGNWIKQSLRDNKPYDKIVRELLTAKGHAWEDGAIGYYIRDDNMPLDSMANTVQTFLGTSLVCAQCHDHPFDQWTQYEFYEMAAYVYGVSTRLNPDNVNEARKLARNEGEAVRTALDRLTRGLSYGVMESNRDLQLPHDYKYKDAKPREVVKPYVIFGKAAAASPTQSRREVWANWITDRQNPRFTLTVANRLWAKVMGRGLIEPLDRMTSDSKPQMPELMAFLNHQMKQYNYDLRQYQRMLYYTDLYNRAVSVQDAEPGSVHHFTGPKLHRMSAEQFWDSLMTLMIPEVDFRRGNISSDGYYSEGYALRNATPAQLIAMAKTNAEFDAKMRGLRDQLAKARDTNDKASIDRLEKAIRDLRQEDPMMAMSNSGGMKPASNDPKGNYKPSPELEYGSNPPTKDPSIWEAHPAYFRRASELKSPEDFGHFLRQFGQSDREVTDNANQEANIIQVMAMFNGPFFNDVTQDRSVLMQNLKSVDNREKIALMYLSLLGREPTGNEMQIVSKALGDGGVYAFNRVIWAILNTREFSFVQ